MTDTDRGFQPAGHHSQERLEKELSDLLFLEPLRGSPQQLRIHEIEITLDRLRRVDPLSIDGALS